MDYTHYTTQQLAQDESFQAWVLHPNQGNQLFWETWLAENPHKHSEVEQARALLLGWQFEEPVVFHEEVDRLRQKVIQQAVIEPVRQPRVPVRLWSYGSVAASIAIVLTTALLYWWARPVQEWVTYHTDYGEVETFMLPDSSEVTLNANSSLRFPANWEASESRKVWLTGEAYFNVAKQVLLPAADTKTSLRKFLVNANALEIAVVGTQFNVYARATKTEVVLEEGVVTIGLEGINNQSAAPLRMQPGEKVTYQKKQFSQKSVKPSDYISWRDRRLKFEEVPLSQVAQAIEETYGVVVVFANQDVADQLFTGTVPSSNLDVLLDALSGIYRLQIAQEDDRLILSKSNLTN